MKHITNIVKDKYYTYTPGEFLPIFVDGKLDNKNAFAVYKLKKLVLR